MRILQQPLQFNLLLEGQEHIHKTHLESITITLCTRQQKRH